ncbi:SUKH-3 domain-containing protein [Pseudonocardia lacus]|uniref:SUKH-3 domain-containing protein n=1 Tax=Pseudonocardia lacus TaxID=2835865 RepID=UPI001BDC623B|nr:SUKH-3 domain-containing protein [Pseudonocardia lacus]
MIDREQAASIATSWVAPRGGAEVEIGLREFDQGWVAWPKTAQAGPGAARMVIDKETGELSQWPSIPVSTIIAQYPDRLAAQLRFPPMALRSLNRAGWKSGRRVPVAVDAWLADQGEALRLVPFSAAARQVLDEFGGLTLDQLDGSGTPLPGHRSLLFPHPACGPLTGAYLGFTEETGIPLFPVGVHGEGPSELAIAPDGRTFLFHPTGEYHLGDSFDDALVTLTTDRPALPLNPDGSVDR